MFSSLLKTGIAGTLHKTAFDRIIRRMPSRKNLPIVLCYHRVVEEIPASHDSIPGMLITCRTLEEHLDWLGRHFQFISLDQLGQGLQSGEGFDRPVVAITFDDGYRDVYHHAFPLLKRKGVPAGVFVVTDLIGTARLYLHDELYLLLCRAWQRPSGARYWEQLLLDAGIRPPENLDRHSAAPLDLTTYLLRALPQTELGAFTRALKERFQLEENRREDFWALSWEMLMEMQRAGFTIGSHTRSHTVLPNENWQMVLAETQGSKRDLEERLGTRIEHFAYPNGSFNREVLRAVVAAGYRLAYTACWHRDPDYPLLTIPRKCLWENCSLDAFGNFSPAMLSCQISGTFDLFKHCRQHHPPGEARGASRQRKQNP